MISCHDLAKIFKDNDLDFFTGVPDSTFRDWMSFLFDENSLTNIPAVNECEAASIASGYHLVTKKIGIIYMQNSGLGKIVNPHTSLLSREVYSIPAIYMIGWRGEPEKKDEPQHKMMGRITISLLKVLEIPYKIFPDNIKEVSEVIDWAKKQAQERNAPSAILIKNKTFEKYVSQVSPKTNYEMSREDAMQIILGSMNGNESIVSTTGKTSRELFEYRINKGEIPRDFLTVGSMGCSSAISLGIASAKKNKQVYIFDGDGAALMQMGTFATIGRQAPKNLHHILFDNECYDSTGGQPSVSPSINFAKIALACNYNFAQIVETKQDLLNAIKDLSNKQGPNLIVVKVNKGARIDLGRPTMTPIENKKSFMKFLENS